MNDSRIGDTLYGKEYIVHPRIIPALVKDCIAKALHVYPDGNWTFEAPFGESWEMRVFEKNYLPPMCAIFRAIRPRRQLVIGPLLGTTESYSIKKTGHHPELIVLCDVDHGSCNWLRNNLAYCYTNLTGPRTGDYHGNLVVIRADSRHIAEELIALGPYDLIFVDGEHTKDALVNDLDICHKSLAAKGVVLVHDIEAATHPVGECYLEWLDAHPEYSHVEISKDIFQNGLGVVWRTEDYLKE